MADIDVIRMFWHGPAPGAYEQLGIGSFLKQGHRVEVYAYGDQALPAGAHLVDANTVLPEARLFSYARGHGKGSYAAFANLFRYKLLHERGGTWADCDLFCLRPFNTLPSACVGRENVFSVNNGVLRFPAGHPLMAQMYEEAEKLGDQIAWGQAGPQLLTRLLPQHPDVVVLPEPTFYPVFWKETWRLFMPAEHDYCAAAVQGSYAVHWWNEMMRRIGIAKDKLPPAGSWLERAAATLPDLHAERWSEAQMNVWILNHSARGLADPMQEFFENRSTLAQALRRLADVCLASGMIAKALSLLDSAHQLDAGDPVVRLRLAQVLTDLGRHADAEPHLQAALADPATRETALRIQATPRRR